MMTPTLTRCSHCTLHTSASCATTTTTRVRVRERARGHRMRRSKQQHTARCKVRGGPTQR
eukprot:scaffold270_cov121-Isochrysis_galbana.AAC.16